MLPVAPIVWEAPPHWKNPRAISKNAPSTIRAANKAVIPTMAPKNTGTPWGWEDSISTSGGVGGIVSTECSSFIIGSLRLFHRRQQIFERPVLGVEEVI